MLNINEKSISKLIRIYKQIYGEDLSVDEAKDVGTKIIHFVIAKKHRNKQNVRRQY